MKALICSFTFVFAGSFATIAGEHPWTGQPGIRQTVREIMLRERTDAINNRIPVRRPEFEVEALFKYPNTQNLSGGSKPVFVANASVVTGTSFLAAQYADSGTVPPDCIGDIGPTQFLLCINGRIRTFNRFGNPDGVLDSTTANFFGSVRGNGDTADPRVRYDRLSGRWFISMLAYETPTRIVLAVSSGSSITSNSSFTFFYFAFSEVGPTPNSDTGGYYDFDTLGIDRQALYIGGNVFDPSGPFYIGSTGFVVNKANLLAGSLAVTAFRQMASDSIVGPFSPQGVDNDDPNSNEGYFIGVDASNNTRLLIRRIVNPGSEAPSITSNIIVNVPSTSLPKGGVVAPGSNFPLQDLDARLFQARMRNGHLITGHNIEVNSTGVADSSGERDAVRWYDISDLTSTPALTQSGTLFDSASTNTRNYWMPSAAMSGQGHIAIGCSVAATNEYPEVAGSLRLATDPAGATGSPSVIQTATANSNDLVNQFNQHRWGDYSTMSVDPNDDMTFWTVQEYSTAPNSWAVRVIQIKAPPPPPPASASPSSLAQGQFDTDVSITGTSANGSGFFDPGPDFPGHIAAAFSGTGITVNRITIIDPTHLTVNVSVAGSASLASRSILISNPDFQTVSNPAILTINSSVDTDGDGIPDWWMQFYFGHTTGQTGDRSRASDDADGDGLTNLQEFKAHTDPRNATSTFRIMSIFRAANGVYVEFSGVAGRSYRLEHKSALTDSGWITVVNNVAGVNGRTTAVDPGGTGSTRGFYRVVVLD